MDSLFGLILLTNYVLHNFLIYSKKCTTFTYNKVIYSNIVYIYIYISSNTLFDYCTLFYLYNFV